MYFCGIDYSLTSPAICYYSTELGDFCFENCQFYFITSKPKYIGKIYKNITGFEQSVDYVNNQDRFDILSEKIINIIDPDTKVFIEGYAFGSKGLVFNIAEATGLLKYKLWIKNISYTIFPPNEIKKFATNKGNANKILMYENFVKETKIDLPNIIGNNVGDNPSSDMIDAYFICKLGYSLSLKDN